MPWTVEGQAKSNELVEGACVDCGAVIWVRKRMQGRQRRCEGCQAERDRERNRLAQREYGRRVGPMKKRDMDVYRVVVDPEGTWGCCSELEWGAVRDLLGRWFLEVGTVLVQVRTGRRFEVRENVNRNGAKALSLVEEGVQDGVLRAVTGRGGAL